MRAAHADVTAVNELERYVVVVDGCERSDEPVRRPEALHRVRRVVDAAAAREVAIVDARTYEVRACWTRCGLGWVVRDVAGWLRQSEGGRHVC